MLSADFTTRRQDWPVRAVPKTDIIGDLWKLIKLNGGAQPSLPGSGRPEAQEAFPTVLIAAENPGMRQSIANHFRHDPCNVLQAGSAALLRDVIVNHSRAIHVLLAGLELADFAKAAKQYRPGMKILFVTSDSNQSQSGILPVDAAATQARDLLRSRI